MSRNGSGTYQAPSGSFNPATNGNSATASDWNLLLADLSAAMTQSVSADGQTPIMSNLNMGNNKLIGLSPGTMPGDSVRYEQVALKEDLSNNTDPLKGAALAGYALTPGATASRNVALKLNELVSAEDNVLPTDTDATAKLQALIDVMALRGGGEIYCPKRYLIDSADLIVKQGVTLRGFWNNLGETDSVDYTNLQSSFVVNPLYTIRLDAEFAAIKGMGVFRKGLTKPTSLADATTKLALFAGNAITIGNGVSKRASDCYVGHCLIIGFNYGVYCDFNERPRIEYVAGDNINGIYLNRVYDMNHMTNCHMWNFWSAHQGWTLTGDAGWRRQGAAYYFGEGVDWGQASECFSYGYDVGFDVNGSDNVVLLNCGSDGWKNNNTHSTGFYARGTTKNLNLVACKSAAKHILVRVEVGYGSNANTVKITGGNLWSASAGTGRGIWLFSGNCIVTGGVSFFDMPTGVFKETADSNLILGDRVFSTVATPITILQANDDRVQVTSPAVYRNCVDSNIGLRSSFDNTAAAHRKTAYGTGSPPSEIIRKARGGATNPAALQTNDVIAELKGQGYDGSTFVEAAMLRFQVSGTPSAGSLSSSMIFSTSNSGTFVDRLAVFPSGNFVPTASNTVSLGQSDLLWSSVWSANATIQTSDERKKTEIAPSSLGLDFVLGLKPVQYKMLEGGKKITGQKYYKDGEECSSDVDGAQAGEIETVSTPGNRTHFGFSAQDVKALIDSAGVDFGGWLLSDKDDPDSTQALRYEEFISPLVKAVQELSARVIILESKQGSKK